MQPSTVLSSLRLSKYGTKSGSLGLPLGHPLQVARRTCARTRSLAVQNLISAVKWVIETDHLTEALFLLVLKHLMGFPIVEVGLGHQHRLAVWQVGNVFHSCMHSVSMTRVLGYAITGIAFEALKIYISGL